MSETALLIDHVLNWVFSKQAFIWKLLGNSPNIQISLTSFILKEHLHLIPPVLFAKWHLVCYFALFPDLLMKRKSSLLVLWHQIMIYFPTTLHVLHVVLKSLAGLLTYGRSPIFVLLLQDLLLSTFLLWWMLFSVWWARGGLRSGTLNLWSLWNLRYSWTSWVNVIEIRSIHIIFVLVH